MSKDSTSTKSKLQWASLVLLLLSGLPCAFTFLNIPSVIQYAVETQNNAGLRLYISLGIASCLAGLGLVLLLTSLLLRKNSNQDLSTGNKND